MALPLLQLLPTPLLLVSLRACVAQHLCSRDTCVCRCIICRCASGPAPSYTCFSAMRPRWCCLMLPLKPMEAAAGWMQHMRVPCPRLPVPLALMIKAFRVLFQGTALPLQTLLLGHLRPATREPPLRSLRCAAVHCNWGGCCVVDAVECGAVFATSAREVAIVGMWGTPQCGLSHPTCSAQACLGSSGAHPHC